MAEKWVEIERPKDGLQYQVKLADFAKRKLWQEPDGGPLMTYQEGGFKITRNADQSVYEPPEEPRATAATKKDDAKP